MLGDLPRAQALWDALDPTKRPGLAGLASHPEDEAAASALLKVFIRDPSTLKFLFDSIQFNAS